VQELTLTVKHKVGLHARPAAKFVKTAKGFTSRISITNLTRGGKTVDAKSLVSLVKIAVACEHTIKLEIEGEDEEQAAEALRVFIEDALEEQP
jgi:phosphotransferase system HPr (HPr) family protein